MAYFPLFVDLRDKKCLIVGGGNIAMRKLLTLLDFDARVMLVAGDISEEIKQISDRYPGRVELNRRDFTPSDCIGVTLTVAATDDRTLNSQIAEICRERGIPVNAVDNKEECTFIFPSYIKERNVVAAFSGGGNSPLITQKLKEQMKESLSPLTGEINELLGEVRSELRGGNASDAAGIYTEIYNECIREGRIITGEELGEILKNHGLSRRV